MDPSEAETSRPRPGAEHGAGAAAPPPLAGWVCARGVRAAEAALLNEVGATLDAAHPVESLSLPPLRVVVPSSSLREHVCRALLRHRGRAVLGLRVQTHRALALEAIEAAGEPLPAGERLFPLIVERLAPTEPRLAESLGALEGGGHLLASTLADFFDAGFAPDHASDLLAAVRGCPVSADEGERAAALIRLAARVAEQLRELGAHHSSAVWVRAAQLLEARGPELLPTRALWLHGFADLTGAGLSWVQAVLRHVGGRWLVVRPADPARSDRAEEAFTEPLVRALARFAGPCEEPATPDAPEAVALLAAEGPVAEARGVAGRVRALLDRGIDPEDVSIVARRFSDLGAPLAVQLERLGIPFSSGAIRAPAGARARAARALVELLRAGAALRPERWLDAHAGGLAHDPRARRALRAAGLGRLDDLLRFDPPAPVVPRASRSPEVVAMLARLARRARRAVEHLRRWPDVAPLAEHRSWLGILLEQHLDWPGAAAVSRPAETVGDTDSPEPDAVELLDDLSAGIAPTLSLERHEIVSLVASIAGRWTAAPRGGGGAGVAVLSVMEARGRSARHLFLMGMNRGVFPRPAAEDPLLPDSMRLAFQGILPAFPRKGRARDEERHLFAELLSASPSVTLSWQEVGASGRIRPASPLLERLRLARSELRPEPVSVPGEPAGRAVGAAALELAHEQATRVALEHGPSALADVLAAALEEVHAEAAGAQAPAASLEAHARLRVIRELEGAPARPGAPPDLGAYLGLVGTPTDAEPETLPITAIEERIRCPWQHFLRRRLRLADLPTPADELAFASPRLVGTLVHRILERLVRRVLDEGEAGGPPSLGEAIHRPARPVPWPSPAELEPLLQEEARRIAAEEGVTAEWLAPVLAGRARPCLGVARAMDWGGDAPPHVLGAELEGEVEVSVNGRAHHIVFRADRVDRVGDTLRATDYKTGKPISSAKRPETRAQHFLAEIRAGRQLQASAYAEALRQLAPDRPGGARYLYLGRAEEGGEREFAVRADDAAWSDAFREACSLALEADALGVFPPRLVAEDGHKEPPACETCEVRLACARGESARRARLVAWARHGAASQQAESTSEGVARRVLGIRGKAAPRRRAAASRTSGEEAEQ